MNNWTGSAVMLAIIGTTMPYNTFQWFLFLASALVLALVGIRKGHIK